ncbi:MAG: helix-turn-helix transcriptional regulator [Nitrospinae bacterium]|nr:helix-turn-helix transcriptional regulator [Nitrospinota bacterium]
MGRHDRFGLTPPSTNPQDHQREPVSMENGSFALPLEGVEGFAHIRFIDLSPVGSFSSVSIPAGFDRPFSYRATRDDPEWQISLIISTLGSENIRLPGVPEMGLFPSPGLQALAVSAGEAILEYDAPEGFSSVAVAASLDWVVENLGLETAPEALRPFLERRAFDRMRRWDLAYTPAAMRLRRDLENNPYQGTSEILFLQARIIDGVVEFYEQLSGGGETDAPLGVKDKKLALEAREILVAAADAPPDLPTLARMTGTNAKKLTALFRTHFGVTPFALLQEHRLDMARARLNSGALNVTEAARQAGYNHPSSFIAAYRKRFGETPGGKSEKA